MKFTTPLFSAALLGLAICTTQAIALPPYYADGHTGTAIVRASGGCTIAPITLTNARMGDIYDSIDDSYVGWGIIDAQGNILVLEYNYATIKYVADNVNGKGQASYFEDFTSGATYNYIENKAGCSISLLDSNSNAKSTFKWNYAKGLDSATLKFGFSGYTYDTCATTNGVETCIGRKFTGSIAFKGNAPVL